jgi:hypothetical protein
MLVTLMAGCTSGSPGRQPTTAVTEHPAGGRFTVVLTSGANRRADAAHVDLPRLVTEVLDRVNTLLPGPQVSITVDDLSASALVPETGTAGHTNLVSGDVIVGFGATPQIGADTAMRTWLPQTLSHELDHSIRILTGPGFGTTLLQMTITEGLASMFEEAASPGPPNPPGHALNPSQECTLWKRAQPLLDHEGLYQQWMFGGEGIPRWTAYTIGYDIVSSYRRHHRTRTGPH